jgi:hypothetical protein
MASSIVNVRRGNTTSSNIRSCDTVSAGAFFPQAYLEVPQKEMCHHARQHIVMPAEVFADLIVVHSSFGFRFLKALLHGPTDATQPHKKGLATTQRGVADIIPIGEVPPKGALEHQPDSEGWQARPAERHATLGKLVRNRAFRPF